MASLRTASSRSPGDFLQGRSDAPELPLDGPVNYYASPVVKSAVRTDAKMHRLGIHRPMLQPDHPQAGYVLPNGIAFVAPPNPNRRSQMKEEFTGADFPAHVYHAVFRTEEEFISIMARGNPEDPQIKTNRSPYNAAGLLPLRVFDWPQQAYTAYRGAMTGFLDDPKLREMTEAGRQFAKARIAMARRGLTTLAEADPKTFLRVTYGLTDPEIVRLRETVLAASERPEDWA